MNWPEIFQWMTAGILGAGGFKLFDLFVMRKPKQRTDIDRELRAELREDNRAMRDEIKCLKDELSTQATKLDQQEAEFNRYRLDVLTRLMTCGVKPELIEELINL